MIGFVAMAVLITILALAFVLRPLWPGTRGLPVALTAGLGLAALGMYALLGTPAALDPAARHAPQTVEEAVAMLERELQNNPQQIDGWRLLARSYAQMQQPQKARDALERAVQLAPDDPDVLVDAAEARAMADPQRRFDARAMQMLQHAVQRQPMHQRAHWFIGISHRQQNRPADAAAEWEKILPMVEPAAAVSLREQIASARKDAGMPPMPATQDVAAPDAGVHIQVALAPGIDTKNLPTTAQVFVIARQIGGPPMPVAVQRHLVSSLPLSITLTDADSPMPTRKLSQLQEVEVLARISMAGSAMRGDGDIESAPVRVTLPAKAPIELTVGASP